MRKPKQLLKLLLLVSLFRLLQKPLLRLVNKLQVPQRNSQPSQQQSLLPNQLQRRSDTPYEHGSLNKIMNDRRRVELRQLQ